MFSSALIVVVVVASTSFPLAVGRKSQAGQTPRTDRTVPLMMLLPLVAALALRDQCHLFPFLGASGCPLRGTVIGEAPIHCTIRTECCVERCTAPHCTSRTTVVLYCTVSNISVLTIGPGWLVHTNQPAQMHRDVSWSRRELDRRPVKD